MSDIMTDYRLHPQRAALLVIDMQRGFIDEGTVMEVPRGRDIVPNVKRLMEACRSASVPVIFTQYLWSPNVPNLIGELHSQHKPPLCCCMEGHESADVIPELSPQDGDLIIRKHGYDAFHQTPLDYALRSMGRDQLIVTGVMTDVCVLATVTSALHHEYRVTVVADGVATLWEETQSVCLDLVGRCYGRVGSTEDVIGEVLR